MENTEKRRAILRAMGLFFAGMVCFTLLSRAVYQQGTAVVTTQTPTRGVISHTVETTGKIAENQELAVFTQPGLRIAEVLVSEGQQVSQGEVLFTLDLAYLEEAILSQQQDMQKLKLSISEGWSQNAAAQQRRANAQAQAQESYNSAVSQAETALERAARNLERAENALDAFYQGIDAGQEQENALLAACQEAESTCQAAAAALDCLRQEQEAAISAAMGEAEADSEEPLTPEERDAIRQTVESSFAQPLADAQLALEGAEQQKSQAQQALEDFRSTQDDGDVSEEALQQNLEAAMDAYEDALASRDNAETVYGRAIRSANLPESSSTSPQINQISYDQMAATLEKLEALREAQGEICAPVDGVVTQCGLRTGEKTTDQSALLLADLSKGCRFSGQITEEQSQYLGVGDKVTLTALSGGKEYQNVPVTTLSQTGEGPYRVTVQLPGNRLALGASVRLQFTQTSQSYACCVSLATLHVDGRNHPYVLVAEPADTVLGPQTQARAVYVTVLEKNEGMAALEPGTLHEDQQIIVSADRPVEGGSRVRVQ